MGNIVYFHGKYTIKWCGDEVFKAWANFKEKETALKWMERKKAAFTELGFEGQNYCIEIVEKTVECED